MGLRYCCVPGCLSNTETDMGLSFFSFPLDPKRCSEWVKNCNRHDFRAKSPIDLHRGYRVCGKHFQPTMFAGMSQSRLKKFAVPTLLMSDNSMMEVEATIPAVPITSEAVSESTSPDVIAIPSTSKEVTSEAVSESTSPDVIAIPSTSKEVTSEGQ
ncbi:52 kDa repressor of the inhibitor of the protein kinase-like isoform X1 [Sitophilus oryzae]|uniref:52 kDa repressor of the inhibitor of the protein kinase-like isoform X1 n=1 Tax=Sitophilus oryzae TaxID=7048 RepID=A0A6J2YQ99_SITOR|nr:52 kDa repressor of the inhibitor of the protein kinase-like isoform X1 [Sitophilus oryzae]